MTPPDASETGADAASAAELAAAGLYDPDAPNAPQRLALLQYLLSIGATIDDLVMKRPDEYGLLVSSISLWGGLDRLTLDEVAAAAGVDKELVARTWRAAGFPDPDPDPNVRVFTRADVEILSILRVASEFFGEDVTVQLIRVLGGAAARVADAAVSTFVVNVATPAAESDPSGLELARANAESIALLDGLTRGFDTLLRHHIERGFRPMESGDAAPGIDLVHRSVGFIDLVDSTSWTQQLDLPALSQALTTFESSASDVVVARGGRVVKLIGDGLMYVADDAVTAAEIALDLVDLFAAQELLPPIRAGIATGEVLARDGDFSGAVVNLAARVVAVARPSALLVEAQTAEALSGLAGFSLGPAGTFKLKGFEKRVTLTRVRRHTV